MKKGFKFEIRHKSKRNWARLGRITTPHGVIKTPAFVIVATNAAVKGGVSVEDLKSIGAQVVLANTYHLMVRDQVKVIKKAGGLSKFMNWSGPTMTDSGGFQVFSLGRRLEEGIGKLIDYNKRKLPKKNKNDYQHSCGRRNVDNDKKCFLRIKNNSRKQLVRISEKGVEFASHIDGRKIKLTPEKAIKNQYNIGADIIFTFDEPTSPVASLKDTRDAMERTHRWALRCLEAYKGGQSLFGIIQGGPYEKLRKESTRFIANLDFSGFGIGGSYYKSKKFKKFKELNWVIPYLPQEKPRHFLGIGGIEDIITGVKQGIDLFDCVIPTREARHGRIYNFESRILASLKLQRGESNFEKKSKFKIQNSKFHILDSKFYKVINIINSKFRNDKTSINNSSLKNYSKAYLHHLFKTQELLGVKLATINNLEFYFQLMRFIRNQIKNDKF